MIVIDSNPLLRLILNDNKEQCDKVVKLLRKEEVLIIAQVIFEIEYVLRKVYGISKKKICDCLDKLLMTKKIVIEEKQILLMTMVLYREKNVDLVDAYLWVRAKELGTTVFSFDKDFEKFN